MEKAWEQGCDMCLISSSFLLSQPSSLLYLRTATKVQNLRLERTTLKTEKTTMKLRQTMGTYVLCLSCAQSFQGVVTHMSLVEEVAAGSRFLIKDNSLSEAFD